MSKLRQPPLKKKAKGFTPVYDVIVHVLGSTTALVFGVIWRFCQMKDGYCWASQEKIGKRIGLSRGKVNMSISDLIKAGFLEDLTPKECGNTHKYCPTQRFLEYLDED